MVTAFTDRRFPLRAYGGAWAGQLRWGHLTHPRVLGVLKNPCYAGAYVPSNLVALVRAGLARGEQVEAVLAEISAINAELLARRELR